MTTANWTQLLALIALILVTAPPLRRYIANVYEGKPMRLDTLFGPVERAIYRICRVDPEREQRWNVYALSVLAFSVVGFLLLYVMLRVQTDLPFNPTNVVNVNATQSFETAVSFMTQHQLLREVWGPQYHDETNYLRVFMAQVRRKLEPEPSRPRYFITEPGMGYRFENAALTRRD
ncbi:MAG: potassium-transporting ATPase subunit KdpA [Acidimicrobiia bacterium]